MKINKLTFPTNLSSYLFFLVFPTLIIYNLLVANGYIPTFLGGYFGAIIGFTAICYLPFFLLSTNENIKTSLNLTLFGLGALLLAILVTASSFFSNVSIHAVEQSALMIVMWFALYNLGFFFNQIEHKKLSKYMLVFCFLFCFYLIYQFFFTGNLGFLQKTEINSVDETNLSGYQAIARNFLIISLFTYSFTQNKYIQILLLGLCAFAIFSIGARSEMVAFILSLITLNLILIFRNKANFITSIVIISIFIFGFMFFNSQFSDSRQLEIFDLQQSSSWSVRQQLQENAIQTISNNWFWGDFGSHANGDNVGNYSHNVLSAYVNFGLIFFVTYLILNFLFLAISFFKLLSNKNSQVWIFSFLMCFVSFFLVITTKPVFWPVPFFAWGLVMGALRMEKFGSP
ncbi:hypothetical protein [Acinetobacter sp. YH1901134]|uniref:hypothetical protein n=1 Tax=Acinetobacter sp. YH1901134 TaxID=2601199 RepID=UPI0015D3A467|nr:hypothetical protein [Acinetobacter sp. YH1901134]